MSVTIPQEFWADRGWSILLRFNDPTFTGEFQVFNGFFSNVFNQKYGLEILISQKTEPDYEDLYMTIIGDNLTSDLKRKCINDGLLAIEYGRGQYRRKFFAKNIFGQNGKCVGLKMP